MNRQSKVFKGIQDFVVAAILALSCLNAAIVRAEEAAPAPQPLTAAQLEQLVAPIALYPDPLLAEVLMASTYPLDIVQAERWLERNKKLKDDHLKAEVDKQPWDESIKSLVATPDVLTMMSTKIDWTRKLGDAVVAQQADIMDAIQRLRAKAQANNKLITTKEQTVSVKQVENRQIIAIEPTEPNNVYVPYYDPAVVYGDWPYSDYPPYYFPPPAYLGPGLIGTGIAFGAGYLLGRWTSGGNFWGGGINWNNNNINIDRPINGVGNNWRPQVDHRQAVGNRGGRQQGLNFRGSNGQQVLNPGGGRGNLGNQNLGGNRANAGNRVNAGNRPSGGNRQNAGNRGNRNTASTRPSGGSRNARKTTGGGQRSARAGNMNSRNRVSAGPQRGGGGGMRAQGGGRLYASGAMRGGGGGGFRGGGSGGFRGGGGGGGRGRRSDIRLKHDIMLIGHLDNGLGFYRFVYNGGHTAYVGVMAQEVQLVAPDDVVRDQSGYLRVQYEKLGLRLQTYDQWVAAGGVIPVTAQGRH